MEHRPWRQHLRLLPGGDADVGTALVATGMLYLLFLMIGGIAVGIVSDQVGAVGGPLGSVSGFSAANVIPCFAIGLWVALRIRATQEVRLDQVGVDLQQRRVHYGDEVPRVPRGALVFSVTPRQTTARMPDGRDITIFFRVNTDPEDLLALGREMRRHPGLEVEDYVHEELKKLLEEILPDPDGVKEVLGEQLLRRGVVVTRAEATGG